MKKLSKLLFILLITGLAYGFQIKNTEIDDFIGNDRLNITVKGGQRAEIEGYLMNGEVYGYLNIEQMISNECFFQGDTKQIDWDNVSIPIQYVAESGCTVAEPRLCCIRRPDEF